jgi:hypothetical protein
MAEANRYLEETFWPAHNARFARVAELAGSAFVPFAGPLEDILCIHEERVVGNDNTVRYRGRTLQIPADRYRHHYVKARVRVHEYPDHTLAIFHGPRCLARYTSDGSLIAAAGQTVARSASTRPDGGLWTSGQLGSRRPAHFPTGPAAATEAVNSSVT